MGDLGARGWKVRVWSRQTTSHRRTAPAGTTNPDRGLTTQEELTFPMAEPQSIAPLRASAEPVTAGVVHVRRRLTANFTILSNRLAQRPGSAVTVGVGAYLMSVPDGVPVDWGMEKT
jgi:hypothetical protein